MKNIRIVPVMAMCAVLCAVWVIVACEPYICVDGTLISESSGESSGLACRNPVPYTCANGTAAYGITHDQNTERCTACAAGFDLDASEQCVTDFVCSNGTVAEGTTIVENTEQCAACDFGFTLSDSKRCVLDFSPVYSVTDNAEMLLHGPRNIVTAVVGGKPYLFVAAHGDDAINVFSIETDGKLTLTDSVADTGDLELDAAYTPNVAVVEGTTYLFVASLFDDGISVFSVGDDGKLTSVYNTDANSTPGSALGWPIFATTAKIGTATYLFVAASTSSAINVFSVDNDGALTLVQVVRDNAELKLSFVQAVTTAVVGGATYLFVVGHDSGISVFSVGTDGMLTSVQNVSDNADLELAGVSSVTSAVVGSTTYLFASGFDDDGVSVFSVGTDGKLTSVQNVSDNDSVRLDNPISVSTSVVKGTTYLFVSGYHSDNIGVFSVGTDGMLTPISNIPDSADLELDGVISTATAEVGGATYLFAAGRFDNGLSVFRIP